MNNAPIKIDLFAFNHRFPTMILLIEKLNILKRAAIICSVACLVSSCASLQAFGFIIAIKYDGTIVLDNEKNVTSYLEYIARNYNDYSMKAFDRKAISQRIRKTKSTTHSFYVIYMTDGSYQTLSFSATSKWATSEGAWALNTETDIESYVSYLEGNNDWEVEKIIPNTTIDTRLTVMNILAKIRSNTTYYFRSSLNKRNNHDNCNTALWETLVKNE
jgi:hypothetical protein